MRKVSLLVAALLVSSSVQAAQYSTKNAETVRGLTGLLGHTAYQLRMMNSWLPRDTEKQLPREATIVFISQDDLDCARMYIEKLVEPLSKKEREPWKSILDDINEQWIAGVRFVPGSRGVTYRQVLAYAALWRQEHWTTSRPAPPPQSKTVRGIVSEDSDEEEK